VVKLIFFGTPTFAVPSLLKLFGSTHEVTAVITQPDRPRGRGQRVSESPVKRMASCHSVRVLQPQKMKDPLFLETLRNLKPDLGVVAAYGKILPAQVLSVPRHGMINVHASLLPRYRGAAPIQRAVMAGETTTGITIIHLVMEMDAGPMLRKASYPILPNDTSEILARALSELGATTLIETIEDLEKSLDSAETQDETLVTFAPRLSKNEGLIDWSRPGLSIHNQVRGLQPWPHAFTYLKGSRYVIHRTTPTDLPVSPASRTTEQFGEILEASADRLTVAAGSGTAVRILEIQPEGKRPLPTRAFLAGYAIEVGSIFHGPS
jgi:methionyl-tRNA formyltransferase